jgi:hypothetical protein
MSEYLVGGAITILKNDGVRQWGWDYPIYEMENNKNVWNQWISPIRECQITCLFGRLGHLSPTASIRRFWPPQVSSCLCWNVPGWKPNKHMRNDGTWLISTLTLCRTSQRTSPKCLDVVSILFHPWHPISPTKCMVYSPTFWLAKPPSYISYPF